MSVSRRSFLLFASEQLNPYAGPKKGTLADVVPPADVAAEKRVPPVPVGARSVSRFRARCVGCFKCVDACPRQLLRPSANPRHFARPALDFRLGWCRPECDRCAEACPAGAILPKAAKAGPNVAVWHRDRCVAATGRDACHACERHCPEKAITLVETVGAFAVPRVDATKCVGCGACEHYCPARPKAAMTVEGRA